MGGSSSKSDTTVINSAIANVINKSVLKSTQNCQNTLNLNQNLTLTCTPSDSVQQLIIQGKTQCALAGKPKSVCDSIVACDFSNIKQSETASFNGSCQVNNQQIQDIQANIQNQLQAAAKQTNDTLGQAFQSLAQGAAGGGSNSNTSSTTNKIINNISNSVDQEFVQSLVNQFAANQNITITGSGVNAKGISQDLQLQITVSTMSSNSNIQTAVAQLSGSATGTADQSNTTFIDNLIDTVGKVVGGATQAYLIICVVGMLILLGFGFLVYKFLGGEGGVTQTAVAVDSLAKNPTISKAMVGGNIKNMKFENWMVIGFVVLGLIWFSCKDKKSKSKVPEDFSIDGRVPCYNKPKYYPNYDDPEDILYRQMTDYNHPLPFNDMNEGFGVAGYLAPVAMIADDQLDEGFCQMGNNCMLFNRFYPNTFAMGSDDHTEYNDLVQEFEPEFPYQYNN